MHVNAIGPGPVANRVIDSRAAQFSPEDAKVGHDFILSKIPMQRYGTNEEVANLALFLASDESTYCTGGIHNDRWRLGRRLNFKKESEIKAIGFSS